MNPYGNLPPFNSNPPFPWLQRHPNPQLWIFPFNDTAICRFARLPSPADYSMAPFDLSDPNWVFVLLPDHLLTFLFLDPFP